MTNKSNKITHRIKIPWINKMSLKIGTHKNKIKIKDNIHSLYKHHKRHNNNIIKAASHRILSNYQNKSKNKV